jgi:hypothetical protein
VFRGGKPVALYEYALSASLSVGLMPPTLPGDWRHVNVYTTIVDDDMYPEGKCMEESVMPTLRKVCTSHTLIRCHTFYL